MNPNRKNLANAFLANPITDTATTMVYQTGYGSGKPAVPYFDTLTPAGQLSTMGNSEIVQVTALSGDTATIVRARKGTTAKAFPAGTIASNGIYVEDKVGSDNIDFATLILGSSIRLEKTSVQSFAATTQVNVDYDIAVPGYDEELFEFGTYSGGTGVKILSPKIKAVSVSSHYQWTTGQGSTTIQNYMYTHQNGVNKSGLMLVAQSGGRQAGIVLPVSVGDIIQARTYSSVANNITAAGSWNNLTVTVVAQKE